MSWTGVEGRNSPISCPRVVVSLPRRPIVGGGSVNTMCECGRLEGVVDGGR